MSQMAKNVFLREIEHQGWLDQFLQTAVGFCARVSGGPAGALVPSFTSRLASGVNLALRESTFFFDVFWYHGNRLSNIMNLIVV